MDEQDFSVRIRADYLSSLQYHTFLHCLAPPCFPFIQTS